MRDRLIAILERFAPSATFAARVSAADSILAAYGEPHRAYHNLAHVSDCLSLFDSMRASAERPDGVEIAIWLHDVVYDVRRSDNEDRSGEFASKILDQLGGEAVAIGTVRDLILATKHRDLPATNDARLIADIDLSILASAPDRYDQYRRQIRDEYSFVTNEQFAAGRGKFLDAMLGRPAIYCTPALAVRCEAAARQNMLRERATLRGDR